jgi:exonuclease V gamma subunit
MRDQLLQAATHIDGDGDADERIDQYLDLARRRGELPPLALGDAVALRARHEVQQLMATAQGLGAVLGIQRGSVDIDLPLPSDTNRRLRGRIEQVGAQQIVHLTVSRHQPGHLLRAWVELAALCLAQPDSSWEAVVVGSASGRVGAAGRRLRLQSLDAARETLIVAGEFTDRARQGVLPLTATLSYALQSGGPAQARQVWTRSSEAASHRWVRWAVGDTDFHDLLELAPWPDEGDDMATDTASSRWGAATGRLERWSHRLWSTFETTVAEEER